MSYHLYLITSVGGRAGFGIASDYKERNKQYASHSGDIVKFSYLYSGLRSHAKAIEKTIKTQFADNIWIVDDWKTEWLKDGITMHDLKEYVDQLLKERPFYRLEVIAEDYDFRQGLLEGTL